MKKTSTVIMSTRKKTPTVKTSKRKKRPHKGGRPKNGHGRNVHVNVQENASRRNEENISSKL